MRIACAIAVVISVKFVIISLACDKKDDLQTINKPLEQRFTDTIDDSIDFISSFFNQDPKPKDNTFLRRIPDHQNKIISSIQLQDIPTRNEITRNDDFNVVKNVHNVIVNGNNNDESLEVKNNPFSNLISLLLDPSDSDGGWPSFSWLNLGRTLMRPDNSFNDPVKSNRLPIKYDTSPKFDSLDIDTRNHEADPDLKLSFIENNQKNTQQTEPNIESMLNEFDESLRGTEKVDNFFFNMNDILDESSVLKEDLVKDIQNRNNALLNSNLQQNTTQTIAEDSKYNNELPTLQSETGISLVDKNNVINKESNIASAKVDSTITNKPKDANSYENTKHVEHLSIPKINKYNSLKGTNITPEVSIVDKLFGILNRKDKSPSVTNDFLTKIAKDISTGTKYFKNIGSHNLDLMIPQSIVTSAPIGKINENLYNYKTEVILGDSSAGDIKNNGYTQNERSDYSINKTTELSSILENFNKWITMKTSKSIKEPQYKNNLTVKQIEQYDNYASPLINCLKEKLKKNRNYDKDYVQSPFNVTNSDTIYPLSHLLKLINGSDNRIILVSNKSEKYAPLERAPVLHGYSKENIRQQLQFKLKNPTTTNQFEDNDKPYSTTKLNDESKSNIFLTVEPTGNEFESKTMNPENNVARSNFVSKNGNMHISNLRKIVENSNDDHKVNDNSGKNTNLHENYDKFYFLSPNSNDEASVNNVEDEMVSQLGVEENLHANTQKQVSDDIFTDLTTPEINMIKIDAKNNIEVTSDRETGGKNIKEVTSDNHEVDNLSELSKKASKPINKGELQNGESYYSTIPNVGNENIPKPLISDNYLWKSVDETKKFKGLPVKPPTQNLEWKSVLKLLNNLINQAEINNDNNLKYILYTIRSKMNTPMTQRLPARFMNYLLNIPQINQNEKTRETTSLPTKYENNIEASLSVQPKIKTSEISTQENHILDGILETSTTIPISESDDIPKLITYSESKYFNREASESNADNDEPGKSKTGDFIDTTTAKITNSRTDKHSSALEAISDGHMSNRDNAGIDSQRYTGSDGNYSDGIILNKPGVVGLNSDKPFQNYVSSNVLQSSGNSEGLVSSPVNPYYSVQWNQATPAGFLNMYDYSTYWNDIKSRLYNIEQFLQKYCVH